MAPRQKLFVLARILQEQRSQTQNLSWFRVPVKMLDLGIIFLVIVNDTYHMMRHVESFRATKIDKKCKNLSNFPTVTLRALLVISYAC
jgi:hypothetical protein